MGAGSTHSRTARTLSPPAAARAPGARGSGLGEGLERRVVITPQRGRRPPRCARRAVGGESGGRGSVGAGPWRAGGAARGRGPAPEHRGFESRPSRPAAGRCALQAPGEATDAADDGRRAGQRSMVRGSRRAGGWGGDGLGRPRGPGRAGCRQLPRPPSARRAGRMSGTLPRDGTEAPGPRREEEPAAAAAPAGRGPTATSGAGLFTSEVFKLERRTCRATPASAMCGVSWPKLRAAAHKTKLRAAALRLRDFPQRRRASTRLCACCTGRFGRAARSARARPGLPTPWPGRGGRRTVWGAPAGPAAGAADVVTPLSLPFPTRSSWSGSGRSVSKCCRSWPGEVGAGIRAGRCNARSARSLHLGTQALRG